MAYIMSASTVGPDNGGWFRPSIRIDDEHEDTMFVFVKDETFADENSAHAVAFGLIQEHIMALRSMLINLNWYRQEVV